MNTEREVIENEQAAYKAYVEWKQGKTDEVIFQVDGFKAGWQAALANKPSTAALQKLIEELEAEPRFFLEHGMWHDRVTGQHMYTQDQYDELRRDAFHNGYQGALAIKAGDVQAPKEGWKLVPLEATREMINAAYKAETKHAIQDYKRTGGNDPELGFGAAYKTMIAAAPTDTEGK